MKPLQYRTLIVLALGLASVPLLWPLAQVVDGPIHPHLWLLVAASALANVVVLFYHYSTPPHPKFLLLPERKLSIRIHVIGGSMELLFGLAAIVTGDPRLATCMALAALCFHIPSALFQTLAVFGARVVMVPGYLLCIGLHAFCAGMLLVHPESRLWLVNTFLVFNVYVWCRIFYFVFDLLELFPDSRYSAAILAAGVLVSPAVLGPIGPAAVAGFVGLYILLYLLLVRPSRERVLELCREKRRETLVHREIREIFEEAGEDPRRFPEADRKAAQAWFERLDDDRDGALALEEVERLLASWNVPDELVHAFIRKYAGQSGRINFHRFYNCFWHVGSVRERARASGALPPPADDRERARQIFDQLDIDRSGHIELFELQLLLLEWGLPPDEVGRYAARFDNGDHRFSFDEFYTKMRPLWDYASKEILGVDRVEGSSNMLARALTRARERLGLLKGRHPDGTAREERAPSP